MIFDIFEQNFRYPTSEAVRGLRKSSFPLNRPPAQTLFCASDQRAVNLQITTIFFHNFLIKIFVTSHAKGARRPSPKHTPQLKDYLLWWPAVRV